MSKDQPVDELIDKFRGALQDYNSNITVYGMYESRAFRYFAEAMQQIIQAECNKARIDELDKIRIDGSSLLRIKDWVITRRYRLNKELQQLLKGEK